MSPDDTAEKEGAYVGVVAEYGSDREDVEGIFTPLTARLSEELEFDSLHLDEMPSSRRVTLRFRHGAKRLFHVSVIRKSGRSLVEMAGMNPAMVLKLIGVCRNHFDRWFGITPDQVLAYERSHKPADPP